MYQSSIKERIKVVEGSKPTCPHWGKICLLEEK